MFQGVPGSLEELKVSTSAELLGDAGSYSELQGATESDKDSQGAAVSGRTASNLAVVKPEQPKFCSAASESICGQTVAFF